MIKVEKIYRESVLRDDPCLDYNLLLVDDDTPDVRGSLTISLVYVNENDADERGEICDVSHWHVDISCQPFAVNFLAQGGAEKLLWLNEFCSVSSRFLSSEDFEVKLKVFGNVAIIAN